MGSVLLETELHYLLRTSTWTPLHLEVAYANLSLTVGRTRLIDRLTLPNWTDAVDARWRWGATSANGRLSLLPGGPAGELTLL